jgi:hypothetical protein
MAKASGKNSKTTAKKTTSPAKKAPSTKSAVRNTAVPRKTASPAAASKRQPTHDEIARLTRSTPPAPAAASTRTGTAPSASSAGPDVIQDSLFV